MDYTFGASLWAVEMGPHPRRLPFARQVALLHYEPANGPYPPCPVGPDGRQVPCSDDNSTDSSQPPELLELYVSRPMIVVTSIGTRGVEVNVKYSVAWSDRTAVHPCRISLYKYGEGVSPQGKRVHTRDWWTPNPTSRAAISMSIEHLDQCSASRSNPLRV